MKLFKAFLLIFLININHVFSIESDLENVDVGLNKKKSKKQKNYYVFHDFDEDFEQLSIEEIQKIQKCLPYCKEKYKSMEEEIKSCKKFLERINLKDVEKLSKKYVRKHKVYWRLLYEIEKVKFCKTSYDFNMDNLMGSKFLQNIFLIKFMHIEWALNSDKINSEEECLMIKEYLHKFKELDVEKAEKLLKKTDLLFCKFHQERVINSNAKVFLVNRVWQDVEFINDDKKNKDLSISFYYYSLIEFLIAQDNEEFLKDAKKIFAQMKKKIQDSFWIEETEKLFNKDLEIQVKK